MKRCSSLSEHAMLGKTPTSESGLSLRLSTGNVVALHPRSQVPMLSIAICSANSGRAMLLVEVFNYQGEGKKKRDLER